MRHVLLAFMLAAVVSYGCARDATPPPTGDPALTAPDNVQTTTPVAELPVVAPAGEVLPVVNPAPGLDPAQPTPAPEVAPPAVTDPVVAPAPAAEPSAEQAQPTAPPPTVGLLELRSTDFKMPSVVLLEYSPMRSHKPTSVWNAGTARYQVLNC